MVIATSQRAAVFKQARVAEVALVHRQTVFETVGGRIAPRQVGHLRLQFQAADANAVDAPGQAQGRRPGPDAHIEHPFRSLGRHRSGQQHRVDSGAVTGFRLHKTQAPTQKAVFGNAGHGIAGHEVGCRDRVSAS